MAEASTQECCGAAAGAVAPRRCPFSLPKSCRITSRTDFEALYSSGRKKVGRYTVVWAKTGAAPESRLGVAAAKNTFHDAHERNRAKRLVRESFRLLRPEFSPGPWDIAIAARFRILSAKEQQVRKDIARAGALLGFLPESAEIHSASETR